MDRCRQQWIALALAATYVFAGTAVVRGSTDDFQSQLDELRRALDTAETSNDAVRFELDLARSKQSNEWLTTQRVSEITSLVQEILTDSDTRLSLQGGSAMMGWSDGFHLSSADGRFRLNIGGLFQSRFLARWLGDRPQGGRLENYDEWRYGFELPRTQITFGGHAFSRGLEYYIETGFGRFDPRGDPRATTDDQRMSFRLWDTWVKFRLTQDLGIKLGQFNLPFTRESLVKAAYQLPIERTSVDSRMGLGRSAAVEFDWASNDRRFMFALSNGSGALWQTLTAFQSRGITPPFAALDLDTLYSVTMRHEWKLLGDWDQFKQFTSPPGSERGVLVGIAGHRQNTERDSSNPVGGFVEGVFWGVTGDISMQFDGASFFASVIYERVTDYGGVTGLNANWLAYVIQGSTYITNQTEMYAQYEGGGPDSNQMGGDALQLFTVGVNHYVDGQDVKFSADIGFSFGEISGFLTVPQTGWATDSRRRDQVVLRTQLQLMF